MLCQVPNKALAPTTEIQSGHWRDIGNPYQATVFVVGTEPWPKCVGPGVRPEGDRRRQQTPKLCKAFPPKAKHWETGIF